VRPLLSMAAPDLARHPTSKLSHGRTAITQQLETEPSAYVQSYLAAAGPPTEMYMDALRSGGSLNILPYGRKGHWPERRFEQSLAKVMAPQPLINHPQTVSAPSIGKHAADRQVLTEPAVGRHNVSKKTALVASASMPTLSVREGWNITSLQGEESREEEEEPIKELVLQGARARRSHDNTLRSAAPLRLAAPLWWCMPEVAVAQADSWDRRQTERMTGAHEALRQLRAGGGTSASQDVRFVKQMYEMRWNRFDILRVLDSA
jgi:hypothetical protein